MFVASQKLARVTLITSLCLAYAIAARAQTPGQPAGQPASAKSTPDVNAEREKIWNSPNMLRARAWLADYCSKSAKVTPEMAKHYQDELANMTPSQMKLWLLKFDHEEEQRQQQYAAFQQANTIGLQHAMAADRATQRAYTQFNQEQSKAAEGEEQQIQEQREFSQSEVQNNQQMGPIGPYPAGFSGYGIFPGYGGVHYHFHYHY